ncbi:hypothetical protein DRP05_14085 [Archaeoglobales archaeon]|nr:MAG: hypothetical protein DRP05_14085 [Archaeoglobales archaeon]
MGTLTIALNDEIERKLREEVERLYGSSKGAISKVIEDALKHYFSSLRKKERLFRAYKGRELVAEAKTLDELSMLLRKRGIDPRTVKVVSSEPFKQVVRSGWR